MDATRFRRIGELFDALARGNPDTQQIQKLEEDVNATVKKLDGKITRVTIDGTTAFEQGASSGF